MFQINFVVPDKHLAEVLTSLQGKVGELSIVAAPEAAVPKPKRARPRRMGMTASAAIDSMPQQFITNDLLAKGYSKGAVYTALARRVATGHVVKVGKGVWRKTVAGAQPEAIEEIINLPKREQASQ